MILHFLKRAQLRVLVGALRRWPRLAINTLIPFLAVVSVSAIETGIASNIRIEEETIPTQGSIRNNRNSGKLYGSR